MSPKARRNAAWVLVVAVIIGWPLSQFTVAADEPPFVLALSWLAILLTALDIVATADTREQQDDQDDEGEGE